MLPCGLAIDTDFGIPESRNLLEDTLYQLSPVGPGWSVRGAVKAVGEGGWSEGRLRVVVEAAPRGMSIVDQSGKILLINSQVEKLFGYSREELLGQQSIEVLAPPAFRAAHPAYREGFFANPQTRSMGIGREASKMATRYLIVDAVGITQMVEINGTFDGKMYKDNHKDRKCRSPDSWKRTTNFLESFWNLEFGIFGISLDLGNPEALRSLIVAFRWVPSPRAFTRVKKTRII